MKAVVTGSKFSQEGNFQENVFYRNCKNLDEIKQAVEDALTGTEIEADIVVVKRAKKR